MYASEGAKIAYFVQLLRDRALRWSQVVLKSNPDISYADFLLKFRSVFDKGSSAAAASHRLLNLKQGKRSMADYSIDFGILAEETGWGQEALKSALLNNVCEALKNELMLRELPSSLDALMTLCIRVDEHLRAHRSAWDPPFRDLPARGAASRESRTLDELGHGGGEEEPMQVGRSRLSAAERNRRRAAGVFVLRPFCRHLPVFVKRACPPVVEGILVGDLSSNNFPPLLMLPVKLMIGTITHTLSALIDSGAEQNFIDASLAAKIHVPTEALLKPLRVSALSGQRLPDITHVTGPLTLVFSGNHSERSHFFVFKAPLTPLVLGYPWLQLHNRQIDWKKGKVLGWGLDCYMNCLQAASPPESPVEPRHVPGNPDLSAVPSLYHDLAAVFCKDRARSLPPHRPYDCSIDLLPGAPLPSSRLYSLSQPERESMEKYITESLAAGIIRRPPRQ